MIWLPMAVLPNIDVTCRVEGKYAAIVGQSDPRVVELRRQHPSFGQFLDGFTDAFRRPKRPSVMLLREDAPETYRYGQAVSAFRDLFAISSIPYKRAVAMLSPRSTLEAFFSNSFDFHPWMIDKNYVRVIAHTPAMMALDEVADFAGQTNPEIPTRYVDAVDEPLLEKLIERWESRFSTTDPTWSDRALTRSLNMATHAARMPFNAIGVLYDTGRLVALWVSAFEILVHPGTGMANQGKVLRLLDRYPPGVSPLSKREAEKVWRCPTLREWALDHIYKARNDYLHGNPVADDRLLMPNTTYDISAYAALLYRLMLGEFLGLSEELPPMPEGTTAEAKVLAMMEQMRLDGFREKIEEALYTMTGHKRMRRSPLYGRGAS